MELEPTGERVVEDFYQSSAENYLIYLCHIVTYDFARSHTAGNVVLDYGCGSGYGSHRIADECDSITGIDISNDAIEYAKGHYRADNLDYRVVKPAEEAPLPFDDNTFDTVLSFQVIEHVRDVDRYLHEIRRVLRPGGVFVCATPDRSTRLFPRQKPWNMWHLVEYSAADLEERLRLHFSSVEVLGMGGDADVIGLELRRARRAKWVALPFTLPFTPERARRWALMQLRRIRSLVGGKPGEAREFSFDESSLWITSDAKPSVNLVAVAGDAATVSSEAKS